MPTRNLLISSLLKDIDNSGMAEISGIIKDFLSFFIDVQNVRQGKHRALVSSSEKDLIHGEVLLEVNKLSSRSVINYQSGNLKIPIERTSSTIQELAPLLLYLKHSDPISEYIFIEEPEAHLHPENQRLLAHLLVKLIRAGLKIIITTHSDYLLEQLGTFVMMSGIDEKDRVKKYKYDKDDYLKPEEVSPYLFTRPPRAKGYQIEPIEVSRKEGISTNEMSRVAQQLYNEHAKVQNDLAAKK
jgi:predicted ATPase